jgi:hypothetical protein
MRTAIATLKSIAPYSQSKAHFTPKLEKEGADAYEERTWRERLHSVDDGRVFIPPMAFKNALSEIAKFLSKQIPGKGKSTYTKHFEAGVMVTEGLTLPIKKVDVPGEWLFVPADGRRGSGKRVKKCFPVIKEWRGEVTFIVIDDTITQAFSRSTCERRAASSASAAFARAITALRPLRGRQGEVDVDGKTQPGTAGRD